MDILSFTRLFPTVYHLTFAANRHSIERHGLHSTRALTDLYPLTPDERTALLTRRRCIQNLHGLSIRDQRPMPESRMKTCLVKITIPDWLDLLNAKLFFFVSEAKALDFAKVYADYDNLLLATDTAALLATHAAHASLSRINTGSFLYNPRPRGRASFIPLADYVYRNKRDTPAELTLDRPIPNILQISTIQLLPAESNP